MNTKETRKTTLYNPIRNIKPVQPKTIKPPTKPVLIKPSILDEDAALIAYLLDEDDSWQVARRIQDAAFDGSTHPNPTDLSHKHIIAPSVQTDD